MPDDYRRGCSRFQVKPDNIIISLVRSDGVRPDMITVRSWKLSMVGNVTYSLRFT